MLTLVKLPTVPLGGVNTQFSARLPGEFASPGTLVAVSNPESGVGGTRSFLPAVEGMRACAALGVVLTHVAFQTGHSTGVA